MRPRRSPRKRERRVPRTRISGVLNLPLRYPRLVVLRCRCAPRTPPRLKGHPALARAEDGIHRPAFRIPHPLVAVTDPLVDPLAAVLRGAIARNGTLHFVCVPLSSCCLWGVVCVRCLIVCECASLGVSVIILMVVRSLIPSFAYTLTLSRILHLVSLRVWSSQLLEWEDTASCTTIYCLQVCSFVPLSLTTPCTSFSSICTTSFVVPGLLVNAMCV
ncbi:hypothetical protein GY45DRAFT_114022 [Cubamyces sp. BRFM 1775]|nr:hypothetical protein GY45DRAFT_114022 [Cubamyces sp. BRFM 1775]